MSIMVILTTMHLKIDRDHVDDDDDDTGHNDEYRGYDQHDHCFMIIAMMMEIEDDVMKENEDGVKKEIEDGVKKER